MIKKIISADWFFDVGGGNGHITSALQNEGVNAVLFEPDKTAVLNAKKNQVKYIFNGMFSTETIFPNSISAIGLFDVLEHIEKDECFLVELYSLLHEDGKLIITVPSYQSLFSDEDKWHMHFRRYNKKDLCKKLHNAGLDVIFSTYIFWFLPPIIWLFRKTFRLKNTAREFTVLPIWIKKTINILLRIERKIIQKGDTIPFGGSFLCIAQKTNEIRR